MRAGIYNLGFLGVGPTAEASEILGWWARRLRYQCVNEQGRGLFVDQKVIDLVPGFADGVRILRDSRYNVAYWNLAQRRLEQDGEGWRVDGERLGFFHFSGFDCTDQTKLSKHSTAFRGDAIPCPLKTIMRHYAEQVLGNDDNTARHIPYAYGHFASGTPIPVHARVMFRTQYDQWSGDPFVHFEADVPPLNPELAPSMSAEELARHVQAIYASTSWRLTRPLRAVKQLLQGKQNVL